MTLACVFPGQGSQSVGMLNGLAAEFPQVRDCFTEASEALGFDLWQLVSAGPEEKLSQTEHTQPAMLAAGVAVWRVWRAQGGPPPAAMAGHSLGEYTALVCAEALDFRDAVLLVRDRGRFMQAAVPAGQGAMAAILGLDDDAVMRVCAEQAQGEVVAAVNFNSPGQVVIAGHTAAVQRAVDAAKAVGAKRAVLLPVSVPSHCALMEGAAQQMAQRLAQVEVRVPRIPVIHNASVTTADTAAAVRANLVEQIHAPVRWVETIQKMTAEGVDKLIECGPGRVLAGLNKRIAPAPTYPVYDAATLGQARAALG